MDPIQLMRMLKILDPQEDAPLDRNGQPIPVELQDPDTRQKPSLDMLRQSVMAPPEKKHVSFGRGLLDHIVAGVTGANIDPNKDYGTRLKTWQAQNAGLQDAATLEQNEGFKKNQNLLGALGAIETERHHGATEDETRRHHGAGEEELNDYHQHVVDQGDRRTKAAETSANAAQTRANAYDRYSSARVKAGFKPYKDQYSSPTQQKAADELAVRDVLSENPHFADFYDDDAKRIIPPSSPGAVGKMFGRKDRADEFKNFVALVRKRRSEIINRRLGREDPNAPPMPKGLEPDPDEDDE